MHPQHDCVAGSSGYRTMVETLELGRDAMNRHAWAEAMDVFVAADSDGGLAAGDLEQLGTAAWWSGQPDQATEALERAFTAYADAGQSSDAARVALVLAYQAFSPPGRLGRRRLAGSGGTSARIGARLAVARPTRRLPRARGADGGPADAGHRARRSGDRARAETPRPRRQLPGDELQGHGPRLRRGPGRPASP